MKKYCAEFLGTLVLVLFGTGIAVVSNGNLIATSLAFGLAIVAMAYSIGKISGCHVNPAVSIACFLDGSLDAGAVVLDRFLRHHLTHIGAARGIADIAGSAAHEGDRQLRQDNHLHQSSPPQ